MSIPIRNLYYLFCYAWERFPEGGSVEVGVDESPNLPELFARMLINATHRILRRGLDRGYRGFVEETRAPRGKLVLDQIIKTQSLRRGAVICAFDELTVDVLHNQIIKATAALMARAKNITPTTAHELRLLVKRLDGVAEIWLQGDMFRRVQLSRNTSQYAPLLKLCEIIFRNLMPEEDGVSSRFADILEDEVQMSRLFEEFLRSFYSLEQRRFRSVGVETLKWDGYAVTPGGAAHLPNMITDITLRASDRVVVVDAKFHKDVLSSAYGAPKVKSGNLYQMLAYLQHTAQRSHGVPVDGILIYPLNGAPVRLHYRLMGHDVQIATIDLSRSWQEIHERLLEILLTDPAAAQRHGVAA